MAWIVDHKRHVTHGVAVVGLLGLGVMGLALSLPAEANFKGADSKQARADHVDPEDKVEASVYSRVMRLRGDIALTNNDLAALGLTEAQAEDVLSRLVEWVQKNQSTMIQADNAAEAARQQLVELERRVRIGEADEREAAGLEKVRRLVTETESACRTLCTEAGVYAIAPAPQDIQSRWQTAREYAHLPLEVRYLPGLDERSVRDLLRATSDHAARSGVQVDSAAAFRSALPLSTTRSMDDVRGTVRTHLSGVRAAEQKSLPVPSELRDDEAGMLMDEHADLGDASR